MKLTHYHYIGPDSCVSLRMGEALLDIQLRHGQQVSLPADHEYTQVLLAQQLLQPADGEPAPAAAEPDTSAESTRKGAK